MQLIKHQLRRCDKNYTCFSVIDMHNALIYLGIIKEESNYFGKDQIHMSGELCYIVKQTYCNKEREENGNIQSVYEI